eukprot:m.244172 g.244172  ORF g.244172 m.244172 type:complete len:285 (+) comp14401_c0_seq1:87-941(+)
MAAAALSNNERLFVQGGVAANMRADARARSDYRAFAVELGPVSSANGSSRLHLDGTDVLVAIKAEIAQVDPALPGLGRVNFSVECSSSASPAFERRGGDQLAAEISQTLRRLCSPRSLNLEKLHIVEQTAWLLAVDVLVLECAGGNLIDAIAMAVKAALSVTRVPEVEITGNGETIPFDFELVDDPHKFRSLDVTRFPTVVTLTRIGRHHVIDASADEEQCGTGRTVVAVTEKGDIAFAHKGGAGALHVSELADVLQQARGCAGELRAALDRAIEASSSGMATD